MHIDIFQGMMENENVVILPAEEEEVLQVVKEVFQVINAAR